MMKADLVFDARAVLGEGPWWDSRTQQLYWVDIEGQSLHTFNPETNQDLARKLNQRVSAVVGRKSGGLMVTLQHGFYSFDPADGKLDFIADPEAQLIGNRFNDGKCDPAGRFWAGTMAITEAPNCGSLYCLNTDLSCARKITDVTVSNGLAWSSDAATMYFIDSPTRSVAVFEYEIQSGHISRRRVAFETPATFGYPDGMTIDSEGMLWIAFWDGGRVCRFDPAHGAVLETIELPVSRPTSCVFGGPDLDTLYITSARIGLDEETKIREPLAGGLFCCRPGVRGVPAFTFGG